ncbi:hypothetical protein FHG89_28015 [Micromonospora orduensis]|uniref:Uncharacterized protein n=1 Tax=Micromonospora orduensis TaxID=1420891 RepID=A0A5C4QIS9_9ACTN|nr:hypothetical protein [Micromonospora orduensis]TNH22972.1 hypothetical protein FHG89_28015 [Micromonospora orduensis]
MDNELWTTSGKRSGHGLDAVVCTMSRVKRTTTGTAKKNARPEIRPGVSRSDGAAVAAGVPLRCSV